MTAWWRTRQGWVDFGHVVWGYITIVGTLAMYVIVLLALTGKLG